MKLSAARVEVLIWTLVYGGLLFAGLGIALARNHESYGIALVVAGALGVVIGAVLVWVRSRLHES